jgi:flagellar basal-body rod protein FlgC
MSFFNSLDISASGLNSQRTRMNVIASNIANLNVTRTPEGGPYRRKDVVFQTTEMGAFGEELKSAMAAQGVEVTEIYEDDSPFLLKYEPNHPDANVDGYVAYPNINIVEEMTNLVSASRSFEANVTVIQATKDMALRALQI